MRSSIACARCRRSKVKCVNNGVGTTCRACETSGRECIYPSPATQQGQRRESSASGMPALDRPPTTETPRRAPRPKKSTASVSGHAASTRESPHAILDALDASVLTPKVWTELFEIFQTHYSTDFPFLHPPTFLKPLRQSSLQGPGAGFGDASASPAPALSPVLLLAFLTLTSRFHPQLVAYHSPSTSKQNPLIASEYYASACRARLATNSGNDLGLPDLQRTQALLMLVLHEWGMCHGARAWVQLGVAIRGAQILGLQFENDLDDMPLARSTALAEEAHHAGVDLGRGNSSFSKGDTFIEQETRRRTFWSCLTMDRYLSSGKYRPQMINVQELRIQLPCSERAFLFGEKVRTLMLGEEVHHVAGRAQIQSQRKASVMLGSKHGSPNGDTPASGDPFSSGDLSRNDEQEGRLEVGADEGILSRYIKVLDLYGRIVKWSCSGGRRREQYPPWDERSTWSVLQSHHIAFRESLPRDMELNAGNISAHITSRTSTPFALLHVVHLLSGIILHREYLPFVPFRCSRPQGPLDPPIFHTDEHKASEGFWEQSAHDLFKTAREIIDLLRICQEWGVLAETPIVGFAAYTAAFLGVYAINFPWMDSNGYMCKGTRDPVKSEAADSPGAEAARKGLEIISHMRRSLQMADGWFKTIKRAHIYYIRIKKDLRQGAKGPRSLSPASADPSEAYRNLSLRDNGPEEHRLLEKTLREYSGGEEEDMEMLDAPEARRDSVETDSTTQRGTPDANAVRQERWNAINTVAAAASQNAANGAYGPGGISLSNPASDHLGPSPAMSPPAPAPYGSGFTPIQLQHQQHQQHQQQLSPRSTPQHQLPHLNQPTPPQLPPAYVQHHFSPPRSSVQSQDAWLDAIDTRFGGDDVAAFVAGTNWQVWAGAAALRGEMGVSGWLSALWAPTSGRG